MEFNWTEITLAIIAIAASVVTHKLDKRKHRAEIAKLTAETTSDNIDNMDKSLDFYEKLAAATNKRLDDVLQKQETIIKENEALRAQVSAVNTKMAQLASIICTKLTCVHREVDDSVIECVYPKKSPKDKIRLKRKTEKV
jgi:predicted  nucleic acid-binding Zn-ribbon protein